MGFQKLTAAVLAAAMGAAPTISPALTASDTAAPWAAAYREALSSFQSTFSSGDSLDEVRWDLTDLDADGTPELLIGDGSYHVSQVSIYYFDGAKAVPVDSDGNGEPDLFGSYGQASFCPQTHTIRSGYSGMGYTTLDYYEYADHKVIHKVSVADNGGAVENESDIEYTVDSHTVTKAEYDAAQERYTNMYWLSLGQGHSCKDTADLDETELWRIYYRQLLANTANDESDSLLTAKYSLIDLFGSKTPELLISDGEYHAAGVSVYTISRNVPVRIGTFGEYGQTVFDYDTDEIVSSYYGMGYFFTSRYQYDGTDGVTLRFSSETNADSGETPVYYRINGEEVSKDVYDAALAAYQKHRTEALGRDFKVTDTDPIDSSLPVTDYIVLGDLDGDSVINAGDAAELLIAAAAIGAGSMQTTDELLVHGDINGDGEVNAADATAILQYAAAVGAGAENVKLTDFV